MMQCPGVDGMVDLMRHEVCDGVTGGDCIGDLDEMLCDEVTDCVTRNKTEVNTHTHYVKLHKHLQCDGVRDCLGGSDEIGCNKRVVCERSMVQGLEYIPEQWLCDGVKDCAGGEDENRRLWLKCDNGEGCYTNASRCDMVTDCKDGSDEIGCDHFSGFKCSNEDKVIGSELLCDGEVNCANGIDERYCGTYTDSGQWGLIEDVYNPRVGAEECKEGRTCKSFSREYLSESLTTAETRLTVHGVKKCGMLYSAEYTVMQCLGLCEEQGARQCLLGEVQALQCSNIDKVYNVRLDNTIQQFTRTSPTEPYEALVFQCASGLCISADKVCNLLNECGDWSDELHCKNHLQCEGEEGLIRTDQRCDGVRDCKGGSDECFIGCPQHSFLSNDYHMLRHGKHLTALLVCIVAVIGFLVNLALVVIIGNELVSDPYMYAAKTRNLIFIEAITLNYQGINVYLFALGYSGLDTSKFFCSYKLQWALSHVCQGAGLLVSTATLNIIALTTLASVIAFCQLIRPAQRSLTTSCWHHYISPVILISAIFLSTFAITYLPTQNFLQDFFSNTATLSVLPLRNATKANLLAFITDYYGGEVSGTHWWEIFVVIKSMFTAEPVTNFYQPIYNNLYSNTETCTLSLIKSNTLANNIHTILLTSSLLILLLINLTVIISGKFYTGLAIHRKKTDYPYTIIHILSLISLLSFLPLTLTSTLHNLSLLSITYYYTSLSLLSYLISGVSNTYLVWYLIRRRLRLARFRKMRYPSMDTLFMYQSEEQSEQSITRM